MSHRVRPHYHWCFSWASIQNTVSKFSAIFGYFFLLFAGSSLVQFDLIFVSCGARFLIFFNFDECDKPWFFFQGQKTCHVGGHGMARFFLSKAASEENK